MMEWQLKDHWEHWIEEARESNIQRRAQSRKEKADEDSGLWQVFWDVINRFLVNIKSLDLFLLEAQDISVAECTL